MLDGTFGQALNYYFWLLALTLAFASSVIFFKLYLKSKGTPLGKVAFYVAINSFLWSMAVGVLSVPSITMVGIYTDIFLLVTSLAGVASMLAAYYRTVIQGLLTPSGYGNLRSFRLYYLPVGLTIAIALFSVIRFVFNIPFLNATANRMSFWGAFGILFLSAALIMLARSRPRKLVYIAIAASLIIGIIVLLGNWFLIRILFNPFTSGPTSDLTGEGLILASLGALLSTRQGLKAWIAQFIPSMGVMLMAALAIIGYIANLPTLYNGGFYVSLSIPTALCFLLIGFAQAWYFWKRS